MLQLRPFQSKAFQASTPYDLEFSGYPIRAIGLQFAATLTGTPATPRDDATFRLLKTPEINQAEQPLIRMSGPTWRHFSAILDGGYDKYAAGVTASTPGQVTGKAMIDFQKIVPGAAINAADKKVFLRGEFSPLADYSATPPTTIVGTLRPFAIADAIDLTQGFLRPKFSEVSVPISNADDVQHVIRFEQDMVVAGFMIQTADNSASNQRVDGLVKSVRIDATGSVGNIELHRKSWGQARTWLGWITGFNQEDYDRSTGVIWLPTISRRNPQWNGAMLFKAGDSVTFHFDMTPTVEEEFTGVTAASGDFCLITTIGFTPVGGSGDSGGQVRSIAAQPVQSLPQDEPANARYRRSLRRAKRLGAI